MAARPLSAPTTRAQAIRGPGAFTPARLAADAPRYAPLGLFLALAMVPVLGALTLDARLFQGLNVWIKPLKFLLALSVYLLTLAWFSRYAAPQVTGRGWWRWHERAVVVAVIAEVVWIGGAAALGVGSHFNESTPLMGAVYGFMGAAAILLTSASTSLALAIHRHDASGLSPAVKTGLVWGLALTLPLTLVTAGTLSAMGGHWIGGTASDAGGMLLTGWSRDGGDLRAAHFFATHALHLVPLAALVSARLFGGHAKAPVHATAVLFAAFVGLLFVEALAGRPFLSSLGR